MVGGRGEGKLNGSVSNKGNVGHGCRLGTKLGKAVPHGTQLPGTAFLGLAGGLWFYLLLPSKIRIGPGYSNLSH